MLKRLEIANRLRNFGEKNFPSMAAFARALGMRPQNLNQYLSGEHPIGPAVREKLRMIGADVSFIEHGRSTKDVTPKQLELFTIKVYDYFGQPAHTLVANEPIVEYITTEDKGDPTKYGVIVRGNMMEPIFNDGEIAIMSCVAKSKNGDLVFVELKNGERIVARMYRQRKQIICVFVNTHYPPRNIDESEVKIIHRIMEKITRY